MSNHPITSEIADRLDEMFDGMTVDPVTGELVATDAPPENVIAELASDLDARIDGYAASWRRRKYNIEIRKAEIARLERANRIDQNRNDHLQSWIAYCMALSGRTKVATAMTTATIVQNGGKQAVEWTMPPEALPIEYVETIVTVKPDTEKARAELEAGVELPFARLVPRGSHLRIK